MLNFQSMQRTLTQSEVLRPFNFLEFKDNTGERVGGQGMGERVRASDTETQDVESRREKKQDRQG